MAEGREAEASPGTEFRLAFRNEKAIRADELGRVLTTLARDYKRLTRGTLVVVSLESGSVLAVLGAIVSAASDAERVAKSTNGFVKALRELLKPGNSKPLPDQQQGTPMQSAERILQLASGSRASVELEHVAADGSTMKLKITHTQVDEARAEHAALKLLDQRAAAPRLTSPDAPQLKADSKYFTDALLRYSGDDDAVSALIAALAEALGTTEGARVLGEIAERLEAAGRKELAARVRGAIRSNGGPKPLLLR